MPLENPFFKNEDEREELEKIIDSEIEKNEKVRDLLPYKYGFDQKAEDQELNINSEAFLLDKSLEINTPESEKLLESLKDKVNILESIILNLAELLELKKTKAVSAYTVDDMIRSKQLEKDCAELFEQIGEDTKLLKGSPIILERKLKELEHAYLQLAGSKEN